MKSRRQREILEIITQKNISTQSELARILRDRNFEITQATISRDIKEMGLVKSNDSTGKHRYVLPMESSSGRELTRLERVIEDTVIGVDFSENLVLVKTLPGSAQLLASLLDHSDWREVLGTLAGDDTVLVIIKDRKNVVDICERIKNKMG